MNNQYNKIKARKQYNHIKELKRKRNKLIAFSLACVLLFTQAKANNNNDLKEKKETANKITKEIEKDLLEEEIELNTSCKITDEERKEFIKLINDISISYDWEEFYITYDEVCNIIDMAETKTECNYKITYDSNEIVNRIKENSLNYLKFSFKYENIFESELMKDSNLYFEDILIEVINDIIEKSTNDIKEDICVFQNLKIVLGNCNKDNKENIITLGQYNPLNNTIIIDLDAIKSLDSLTNKINSIYLYETLYHELSHARQQICKCRQDKGQQLYDVSYSYPRSSFIIESSAESVIYNQELDKDLNIDKENLYSFHTYSLERTAEELLFTLALSNDLSKTVDEYYNAVFDSNLKELWHFCGAESNEEIYRLHKIMYTLDGIFKRNDLLLKTTKEEEMETDKIQQHIGYDYRVELFKWSLTNLINETCSNNISLEENLVIFNIIKNNIVNSLFTATFEFSSDAEIIAKYDLEFVEDIYKLENTYIDFLCKYYNLSKEEIRSLEENEIIYTIYNLVSIIKYNLEDTTQSLTKENKLIEKYPLIENLLINKYYYNDYELFLERTENQFNNNSYLKIRKK